MNLYTKNILNHYKHSPHRGKLKKFDFKNKKSNPFCGDVLEVRYSLKGGKIDKISFDGPGCAISRASASMVCEYLRGKPQSAIKELTKEKILEMIGIDLGPTRVKCAMLVKDVLQD